MSQPLKITLIVITILAMLGLLMFGYISTRNLDEQPAAKPKSNISQHLQLEEADEKALEDRDNETEDEDGDAAVVEDDDFETYSEPDEQAWNEVPAAEEEKPTDLPPATTEIEDPPTPDSIYYVITGSFGKRSNARKNRKRLRDLGYEQAEIISFNNSLQSVYAAKFNARKLAESFVQELSRKHKQKAFVKAVAALE